MVGVASSAPLMCISLGGGSRAGGWGVQEAREFAEEDEPLDVTRKG